jgi:hypothetical protein
MYLNVIELCKNLYGMQEVIGSTPIFSTDNWPFANNCKRLFCVRTLSKPAYIDLLH